MCQNAALCGNGLIEKKEMLVHTRDQTSDLLFSRPVPYQPNSAVTSLTLAHRKVFQK